MTKNEELQLLRYRISASFQKNMYLFLLIEVDLLKSSQAKFLFMEDTIAAHSYTFGSFCGCSIQPVDLVCFYNSLNPSDWIYRTAA